jgi:hypothetical protein
LGFPEGRGESAILAFEHPDQLQLFAVTLHEDGPARWPPWEIEEHERVELGALVFDLPLADLAISPGVLGEAREGELTRSLPAPVRSFAASMNASGPEPWQATEGISERLGSVRIAGQPTSCMPFALEQFEFPARDDTRFLVEAGDGVALVGDGARQVFRFDIGGAWTPVEVVGAPVDEPLWSAFRAPDGELWFGGKRLFRGQLNERLELSAVPDSTVTGTITMLDGGRDVDGQLELFALTAGGDMLRFEEPRWTLLHHFGGENETSFRLGLVWMNPGEAFAVHQSSTAAIRYLQGAVQEEQVAAQGMSALGYVPNLGLIAGGQAGAVFVRNDGGDWSQIAEAPTLPSVVRVISPHSSGFLYGGGSGLLVQYRNEQGFCDPQAVRENAVEGLLFMGEDVALLRGDDFRDENWLQRLTLQE